MQTPSEEAERKAAAERNRAKYPKFAAFVDAIRVWDPEAKVTKIYPEHCE